MDSFLDRFCIIFLTFGSQNVRGTVLKVGLAQMWSVPNITQNTLNIVEWIEKANSQGVQVLAFPECAISSYNISYIKTLSAANFDEAAEKISQASKKYGIAVVVGTPGYYKPGDRAFPSANGRLFNQAWIFDENGRLMYRYSKQGLAGWDGQGDSAWAAPGYELSTFSLLGVNMSVMICHDSRFPEITRLPVMAGARLVFMISDEAASPSKEDNYKAQIQARAEENMVWVAHVNTPYFPGCLPSNPVCSHGQSLFASPNGNVTESPIGSVTEEELLVYALDIAEASAGNTMEALRSDYSYHSWWQQALSHIGHAV
eukprot:m.77698 g.77698  ORF g.77698 m.77698 type:complete len:315 (+) comp12637_c0_seq5:97-1041(+)